jgi:Uma2 family endonuclease
MAVLEKEIVDPGAELQPGLLLVLKAPRDLIDEDQFQRLCGANSDLRLERVASGEIIIMAPAGSESSHKNFKLSIQLGIWTEKDGTGLAFDSSAGFTLPNGAVLSPDASWIKRERWDALSRQDKERFSPICPDFVVELRSRTDRISIVRAKMREYIENGARLGWLIDPQTKQVEVYRPNQAATVLKEPAAVSGEDVLPGFVLDLAPIWE